MSLLTSSIARFAALAVAVFVASVRTAGQTPPNDECANATVLPSDGPFPLTGMEQGTDLATSNLGDPGTCLSNRNGKTVWFQWTADSDCTARFDTCGTDYPTIVAVYSGPCGAVGSYIACSFNTRSGPCPNMQLSRVQWPARTGTTYRVFVANPSPTGRGGTIHYRLDCLPGAPSNDNCDGATVLPSEGPFPVVGVELNTDLANSNQQASPPLCAFPGVSNDVWFTWQPPTDCNATFDTCDSDYDTVVEVWRGTCDGFSQGVACNDDTGIGPCARTQQSFVSWFAESRFSYVIRVSNFGDLGGGTLHYALDCRGDAPPNASCATPNVLPATGPYPIVGNEDTTGAPPSRTFQGNYCSRGAQSNSVWFEWTPAVDCAASFHTCGSEYDTEVAVFTGTCAALGTAIICADDVLDGPCGRSLQAYVIWPALAGTTYRIEVTKPGQPGGGLLAYALDCDTNPPPNDACTNPTTLDCAPYPQFLLEVTTHSTTSATDPPLPCSSVGMPSNSHSVWFRYVPDCTRTATFATCGSTYDTVLTVFTGSCDDSAPIECNHGDCVAGSFVSFIAQPGVPYLIEVTAFGDGPGGLLRLESRCVDDIPPVLQCPTEITTECTGAGGALVTYYPTASDDCSGIAGIACLPTSGSHFPVGTTEVTCHASDRLGNTSSCTFHVTVVDSIAPVVHCPANISLEVSDVEEPVAYDVTATDFCDDDPLVQCEPPSGSLFPAGVTLVSCLATDSSGHAATCSFEVSVHACVDFDRTAIGTVPDGTFIERQYAALGVLISGRSYGGSIGAIARQPQPPSTEDLIPVTPPNYLQTFGGDDSSDSGVITFTFVDLLNGGPGLASHASVTFLDVESSGAGESRLEGYDVRGGLVATVVVPRGPNAGQFSAEIGEPGGPLRMSMIVARVGSPFDSASIDHFCWTIEPAGIEAKLLGPGRDVPIGENVDLRLFIRNASGRSTPVLASLTARIGSVRRPRTIDGPRLITLSPRLTHMDPPLLRRVHVPPDPRLIGRTATFSAAFVDPPTSTSLATSVTEVRFGAPH
ncbi:MAG: HYR domain-containing protein [Planctomycetes bacterium]|nr:HYR domain-containing protein [Planctomycetota bacterium]